MTCLSDFFAAIWRWYYGREDRPARTSAARKPVLDEAEEILSGIRESSRRFEARKKRDREAFAQLKARHGNDPNFREMMNRLGFSQITGTRGLYWQGPSNTRCDVPEDE